MQSIRETDTGCFFMQAETAGDYAIIQAVFCRI